jgi:hypothetical protein
VNAAELHALSKATRVPDPQVLKNKGFAGKNGKSPQLLRARGATFAARGNKINGDPVAHHQAMKFDFIVCLGILLAAVFLATMGAFLLYVPALTLLTVIALLLGLGLMFALGILTGRRARKVSPFTHRAVPIR